MTVASIKVLVWIFINLLKKKKKKKKKNGKPLNMSGSLFWRNPQIRSADPVL
jgi:hypothetical protein